MFDTNKATERIKPFYSIIGYHWIPFTGAAVAQAAVTQDEDQSPVNQKVSGSTLGFPRLHVKVSLAPVATPTDASTSKLMCECLEESTA